MKLNPNLLDITDFNIKECSFAGDECIWVFPKLEGTKWTTENEILRSSIWRKSDYELVSPGFKKFFNWEQTPLVHPAPLRLHEKIQCVEKMDGSCLIVSKYKKQLITRTRRALTASLLNGEELEKVLKVKYPKVFDNAIINSEQYTMLFEWVTPSNQIVLNYPEPDLYLTGMICHADYSYCTQQTLDDNARDLGVKRPKYFTYKSVEEMLAQVNELKGAEGVCVYYGNGQRIRKVKSEWYITMHNFRTEMNLKNIVDLYQEHNMPSYDDFCTLVLNQFEYEGLLQAKPLISQICDAKRESDKIRDGMLRFLENNKGKSRKEMAAHIISSYGITNRADMVFSLLDGKELNKKQWKKLLFQTLIAL